MGRLRRPIPFKDGDDFLNSPLICNVKDLFYVKLPRIVARPRWNRIKQRNEDKQNCHHDVDFCHDSSPENIREIMLVIEEADLCMHASCLLGELSKSLAVDLLEWRWRNHFWLWSRNHTFLLLFVHYSRASSIFPMIRGQFDLHSESWLPSRFCNVRFRTKDSIPH